MTGNCADVAETPDGPYQSNFKAKPLSIMYVTLKVSETTGTGIVYSMSFNDIASTLKLSRTLSGILFSQFDPKAVSNCRSSEGIVVVMVCTIGTRWMPTRTQPTITKETNKTRSRLSFVLGTWRIMMMVIGTRKSTNVIDRSPATQ